MNKYGAVKTDYQGVRYDSKLESKVAWELDILKRAGKIKDWKRQIPLVLYAHNRKICVYKIDFLLENNDGTVEYLEVKGHPTPTWRLKWKLLAAQLADTNPTAIMTIYGQAPRKVIDIS